MKGNSVIYNISKNKLYVPLPDFATRSFLERPNFTRFKNQRSKSATQQKAKCFVLL